MLLLQEVQTARRLARMKRIIMQLFELYVGLVLVAAMSAQMPQGVKQDWARAQLEQSSRHREYVTLSHGGRTLNALVVYPEVKAKAPVIVMIHEIFGLSDWAKLMADELAAKGYIVIAPDLLSGVGPGSGGTDALMTQGGQDAVIKGIQTLDPMQVNADLDAAADFGKKLPSADGKLFVAGFCWGGGKAFLFATHRTDLSASFVFYGPPPPAAAMSSISAPVYGFYAGNDARVDATIPQTITDMKAAKKFYDPVTYEDAGHGFMRAGQAPEAKPADVKAWNEGFARLLKELRLNARQHAIASSPRHVRPSARVLVTSTRNVECSHGL